MLFAKSVILLLSFNVAFSQKKKDFTCVPMDSCQCMFQNGFGINLIGLNVSFETTDKYIYFHPCYNIVPSENIIVNNTIAQNECKGGSSLCYYDRIDSNHFKMINLGTAESFKFQTNIDGTKVSLVSEYNSWTTTVYLECASEASGGALALKHLNSNDKEIELTLISKNSCLTDEFSSIKLSRWTVFFIVICTLLLLYFVGGSFLNWFLFGVQGVEMIPNYSFWNAVVSRIKKIPSYCGGCCRSSNGYDEI